MDEFLKVANQFGLSITIMLTTIVALSYWIVKKTVPKELHDYQVNHLQEELSELTDGMQKLTRLTEDNLKTLETLNGAVSAQNQVLSDMAKHIEFTNRQNKQNKRREK